jgi:plasmid maintenance system antidote protein VapI
MANQTHANKGNTSLGLTDAGKMIQIAVITADMTNKQLAEEAGLNPNTLSQLQHGRIPLTEDNAMAIMEVFEKKGHDISELANFVSADTPISLADHPIKHRRLITQIANAHLTDEQLDNIKDILDANMATNAKAGVRTRQKRTHASKRAVA